MIRKMPAAKFPKNRGWRRVANLIIILMPKPFAHGVSKTKCCLLSVPDNNGFGTSSGPTKDVRSLRALFRNCYFWDSLMFRGTIKPSGEREQLKSGRIVSRPSVRDFKNWRAPNE